MRQIVIVFLCVFLVNTTFGQRNSLSDRIKEYAKQNKKVKTFHIKVKDGKTRAYYYFNKLDRKICAYARFQDGGMSRYYYKNGNLLFYFNLPKREVSNQRKGGFYYFSEGILQEKEEYNIPSKDPLKILKEATDILRKAGQMTNK